MIENKVKAQVYDSDMPSSELDSLILTSAERKKGIFRLIIFSAIGLFVFLVPFPTRGLLQLCSVLSIISSLICLATRSTGF